LALETSSIAFSHGVAKVNEKGALSPMKKVCYLNSSCSARSLFFLKKKAVQPGLVIDNFLGLVSCLAASGIWNH